MGTEDGRRLSRRLHWDGERGTSATPETPGTTGGPAIDADGWDARGWDARGRDARVDWPRDEEGAVAASFAAVPAVPSFERRDLERMDADAMDRRRQLWRDTALILSGLVAALLVANTVLPELTGVGAVSPSPGAPDVLAAPSPSGQEAVGATPAPSVAARPGGEPRRSANPEVTLPPTGTHPPSTPKPIVTPRPTRPPTAPPTAPPPTEPPPTPQVTPIPPPTVHVSCSAVLLQVSCSVTMTDGVAGSESWDMHGSGTVVAGGDGSDSITFLYDNADTYHVVVTITGLDGSSASDGTDVTASAT